DMDSDDDVWDDDASIPDAQYDKQVAERNWNRLQDTHGVAGYKDGITEGKKASLQQGFDQGYGNGVDIGLQLGRLRGIAKCVSISVEHVFTLSYFR
ncbi:essential protein Yae1, N terminal-domain-containing protein, partial [Powellomyces hirtus]